MVDDKVVFNDEDLFWKELYKDFQKTESDLEEYIDILQEWADSQPHFPERPSREVLRFTILCNKFSIEKAKEKMDVYYSLRNLMPEYFKTNPLSADIIFHNKVCILVPLPKPTKNHGRIVYNTFNPDYDDPKNFVHDKLLCAFVHLMEYMIREDLCYRYHYIFDAKILTLGHIANIKPMSLKKFVVILEKLFSNRLASIHVINVGSAFENFINVVVKPILNVKLRERLKIHLNLEEMIELYGRDRLPSDIGGDLKSTSELNDLLRQEYEKNKELYSKLEQLSVDEALRPTQLKNDELLGYYGNFKKINLD